jgi:UDP-N-acetylmuramoylalanine--D-glutamate ligase
MKEKKTVLIMGLGNHGGGAAAANYFSSLEENVIVTDLKTKDELKRGLSLIKNPERIRFVLGLHDLKDFRDADLVIMNPAVPPDSPYIAHARKLGTQIETDMGIFLDKINDLTGDIIGVTGTKGKSTTAALIHSIVQHEYGEALIGGNITVSVFDLLPRVRRGSCIVLELSSFQLGGIKNKGFSPPFAVFTNFFEDHLNFYPDTEEYFQDKSIIYKFQKNGDVIVVNRENPVINLIQKGKGVRQVSFGLGENFDDDGTFIKDDVIYYRRAKKAFPVLNTASIRLAGRHNLYNVLAAVAVACCRDIPPEAIARRVADFSGLEHRLEYVCTREGIRFINDSAATTPESAIQGIMSVTRPLTLIAGGYDKGLNLDTFAETINNQVASLVLLKGSGTDRLMEQKLKKGYSLFDNLGDAVHFAYRVSPPSTTVLLSPGFASFGMFDNEFERGAQFKTLVENITESRDKSRKGKLL